MCHSAHALHFIQILQLVVLQTNKKVGLIICLQEEIAKVKYSFEEYATGQTDAVDNEAQQQIKDLHDRDGKLRNRLMARLDTAYSKVASSNL